MIKAKFCPPENETFSKDVRKRVNQYFKSNNIKRTGNFSLYSKTAILYAAYLAPLVCILVFDQMPIWLYFGLFLSMGIGLAGIGFSVMHDAVHGSYSSNRKVNDLLGHLSMFVLGGFVANWRIQHNVLHHTYTNVKDLDEDISTIEFLLRFSPDFPKKWIHKFQFLYAWLFYSLLTISWVVVDDVKQLLHYKKEGFYDNRPAEFRKEVIRLVIFKLSYFALFLVFPLFVTDYSFGMLVLGFLTMHLSAGLIVSSVFQPAHVTTHTEFPQVENDTCISNSWAIHQIQTTQNFAMTNKLLSWYIGGLNFQIEHHLFPNISHVHYKKLSPIVQQVAKEHNLPYFNLPSFRSALLDHGKMLYRLGRV